MNRCVNYGAVAGLSALFAAAAAVPAAAAAAPAPTTKAASVSLSGVDMQYADDSIRPQDDLYRYLNGKWLANFRIPPDKASYSIFTALRDETDRQLRAVVDGLEHAPQRDAEAQKVADLYASFMDEARIDALGLAPLQSEFRDIDALTDKRSLPGLIARFNRGIGSAPYDISIQQDARDSSKYAVSLSQSGLGLPDRDYYISGNAKFAAVRRQYRAHIATMLAKAGVADAATSAGAILRLETALAKIQWTKVENRDPIKTYNKTLIADLPRLMPDYDWQRYVGAMGFAGKVDYVIIAQPSYFKRLAGLIDATPLPVWRAYFKWHLLNAAAPYLSKPFVDENFAFAGTVLSGIPQNRPRWQRSLALVNAAMGEALGKLYVAKYFPPQNKARIRALVENLIAAYRRDIGTLDWMSPPTRQGALAKLDKLVMKIGYPERWRDYGALVIRRDDLFGNVERADEFEYKRDLAKLGKPVDRSEWFMPPQTVNAYYNPLMNEIVFPAAILQPPYFDVHADDAANYGGIGAVIGHEISHGFDDHGSQFDADGNLHDWFTPQDHAKFAAKTRALVAQYDRYEPVPGFHVNGKLTLGENIADNSGLAIAHTAYQIALAGKPAPVIGGLTGDQRFFYGWVGVWRGKMREAETIRMLKIDPHSPADVRGDAPVRNLAAFYSAFGVRPADKMYLPPDQRVSIW